MFSDEGMTLTEAAKFLNMTRNSLKKRTDRNTITWALDENGARRIPFAELDRIAAGTSKPQDFNFDPYSYDPTFDIPKAELWGNGKAPVIQLPKNKQWITVMGVSDIHVPYHDMVLVDATIQLAKDLDPDIFIINGDTNDFFGLSRFNRSLERRDMLQTELDQGKQIRRAYKEAIPNADFHETLGNHEERLLTYPGFNAPMLSSLDALKPSKLMGLEELEIKHWPTNGFRLQEDFLVEHGSIVRSQSGASAKARLEQTLISGVMGHVHRLDTHRRQGYKDLVWIEQGCLCMLNPDYVKSEANWKQGFWIGTFSVKTGNFNVQTVPSVGHGFIFDNKHYGDTNIEADIWVGPSANFEKDVPSDFAKQMANGHV